MIILSRLIKDNGEDKVSIVKLNITKINTAKLSTILAYKNEIISTNV